MASPRREVDRPTIALIGRPNVGKSTLFNRLIKKRRAIVDDLAGVTRDRIYGVSEWQGYEFNVIDCGGLGEESDDPLWQHVAEISRQALAEADAVVLLVDARSGHTTGDDEVVKLLRKAKKPVVVAVNKVEGVKQEPDAYQFYSLGYNDLFLISGLTGRGVGELLETLTAQLDWSQWPEATPEYFKWRYFQADRPEVEAGAGPDEAERRRIAEAIAAHEASLEQWDESEDEVLGVRDSVLGEERAEGPQDEPAARGATGTLEPKTLNLEPHPHDADKIDADLPDELDAADDDAYPFAFADDDAPRFVPDESWREKPVRLVLVGRQNAGKSSLTNALLGEQRALVNPLPGTTRDPLYAEFHRADTKFEILDTAGMKRISRISQDVDFYSLVRAEKSLRYSQVAVLVVDFAQGLTEQDKRIASKIAEDRKAVVIAASKADLIQMPQAPEEDEAGETPAERRRRQRRESSTTSEPERKMIEQMWLDYLRRELDELRWAEVVFTSVTEPRGLDELCQAAIRARDNYHKRIDNTALRQVWQEAITLNPPPVVKNRELRFFDFRQIGNCPPAFLIEVNDKHLLRTSYKRFMENTLRKHFDFTGTHLNLVWYTKQRRKR